MLTADRIVTGAVSALLGAGLSWGAYALQIGGRVDAIERTLVRIETRLDAQPQRVEVKP